MTKMLTFLFMSQTGEKILNTVLFGILLQTANMRRFRDL